MVATPAGVGAGVGAGPAGAGTGAAGAFERRKIAGSSSEPVRFLNSGSLRFSSTSSGLAMKKLE